MTQKNKLVQNRGCVHLFGNVCSPALAQAGLKFATSNHPGASNLADSTRFLMDNVYVDDLLAACRSVSEAVHHLKCIRKVLSYYGIRLHKIVSNRPSVIDHFPESERAKNTSSKSLGNDEVHRALGLAWHVGRDVLFIKVELSVRPMTRRGMLSMTSSIYDPLGIVGPIVLQGKLLQREALSTINCRESQNWDSPLPEKI